jgi:uncharacterized repeat protein (TIGR02543 family)
MKKSISRVAVVLLALCPEVAMAQTSTINFDNVASGTSIGSLYSSSGVTFKCYNGKGSNNKCANNVYAVSDTTNRSAPNVISLSKAGTLTDPLMNEQSGYAVAVFASPVGSVSVDALAAVVAEFVDVIAAKNNKPFLQVFGPVNPTTGKNPLLQTVYYSQSLSDLGTTKWGTWETLSVTRSSNDIGMIVLSSGYASGSTPVYGIFDNLKFTTLSSKLNVSVTGTGRGKVVSSPSGISASTSASGSFPSGSTVVLTATPNDPVITREMGSNPPKNPKHPAKVPLARKLPMQTSYTFDGWSGDAGACSPTQTTCSIVMDREKSVSAVFTAHTSPLKFTAPTP